MEYRGERVSFGRTMMQALELLQLAKRHISRQSNIDRWRNQACSYSHYQVMLVWRHQLVNVHHGVHLGIYLWRSMHGFCILWNSFDLKCGSVINIGHRCPLCLGRQTYIFPSTQWANPVFFTCLWLNNFVLWLKSNWDIIKANCLQLLGAQTRCSQRFFTGSAPPPCSTTVYRPFLLFHYVLHLALLYTLSMCILKHSK